MHVVTTPKQSGTKRFSATVWNHSELSPSCADDPACHSRHSGQKTLRNAVHSWSFLTVGPAICLRQLNVTEDGQEWRSVTCRSATGSHAGITRCSFLLLAVTTLSCAMTASALISTFHDPWRNEMPLQASGHDHRWCGLFNGNNFATSASLAFLEYALYWVPF